MFEPAEGRLWVDPYISTQMLRAHIDPTSDSASRRPEAIDNEVNTLVAQLGLSEGDSVLDLGCGPGLYSIRLARLALKVTGIDYSDNSVAYARTAAEKEGLSIAYRVQDYLSLEDRDAYHAVLLIYGDFGVLADEQRDLLLERIYRALRPGGVFAFDVMSAKAFDAEQPGRWWKVEEAGFWQPHPHLVLEERLVYPEDEVSLRQYGIVDERGELMVYRVWTRHYSPEVLEQLLDRHGLYVENMMSGLTGEPCSEAAEWLGVVARRK